ncbi:MAG: ATP-binding protein [Pseudomonadota bacterium]
MTDFLAAFSRDAAGRVENRLRLDDAVIVLGEVLNNIVEHACAGSAGTGIDITVDFGPTAIMIEATDDGRPLPPSCLTGASLPASDMAMDDLPEGGFGWFMIHEIAEDMAYERTDGRNHLTFSVPT